MTEPRPSGTDVDDRTAILEIEGSYASCADSGDGDGWAALFTEDGVYQWPVIAGMPEAPAALRGREALAATIKGLPGTCMHRMNTPQITLDGDRATSRTHFVFEWAYQDDHGVRHERELVGFYHTEYVRAADGWKIRNRVTVPYAVTDSSRCGYRSEIEIPRP